MTNLSVNVNKVALLRNQRDIGIPSVTGCARMCLEAGAAGITVHPRPDERHIRESDVYELQALLADWPDAEYNIEGNPVARYMDIIRRVRPDQATLVPDAPDQSTSDHGWDVAAEAERLKEIVAELESLGVRVSLFMDPDAEAIGRAAATGADRVELYTAPYAEAFGGPDEDGVVATYARAAEAAAEAGLGVNAGHDLNLGNVGRFCRAVPGVLEVSIGHALIAEALQMGLGATVRAYGKVLSGT
jgi:pyridoxine 5-phosphate synthase